MIKDKANGVGGMSDIFWECFSLHAIADAFKIGVVQIVPSTVRGQAGRRKDGTT